VKKQGRRGKIPPLHVVESFMLSLTNASAGIVNCRYRYCQLILINDLPDGRITLAVNKLPGNIDSIEIKHQLLNPAPHFKEVVEEARSVVLAGGTMSPVSAKMIRSVLWNRVTHSQTCLFVHQMSDVISQLFSHLPSDKITTFSCGHIIPETNLQTLVISKGPSGNELEFKADKQGDPAIVIRCVLYSLLKLFLNFGKQITQLGQILLNFANIIPAGMIIFFPSYRFLNTVKTHWTKSQTLDKFATKKKVGELWLIFELYNTDYRVGIL